MVILVHVDVTLICQQQVGVYCILRPNVPQLNGTHAPVHLHDLKENVIYQTRLPSSIDL